MWRSWTSGPRSAQQAPGCSTFGTPTAPAFTTRRATDRTDELHVRVSADNRRLAGIAEHLLDDLVGVVLREDLLVASRRRMAEADRPEPIDVERDGEWEALEVVGLLVGEPRRDPVRQAVRLGVHAPTDLERNPVGVSLDCVYVGQLADERERFARHRPGDDVTADYDRVGTFALDLLEHCFERGDVAVDVVQGGDGTRPTLTLRDQASHGHRRRDPGARRRIWPNLEVRTGYARRERSRHVRHARARDPTRRFPCIEAENPAFAGFPV